MRFRQLFVPMVLLSLLVSAPAAAAWPEPRPLGQKLDAPYYGVHAGLAAVGFGASLGLSKWVGEHRGEHWNSFLLDDLVELNFSESAAHLSDRLLLVNVALPVFAQMGNGFDTSFGNAALIYGQSHALTLFLTTTTKLAARRARPFTRSPDPRIQEFADNEGSEAYVSFFSGHSSHSFTAAMAGSILYSARTDEPYARHTIWGLQFMLAGMTAQLRVRAGRHYRSDIWVGTLVGAGVGVLVPWLHHVDLGRVEKSEWGMALGATAITMGLSEVVNFCDLLDAVGLCEAPRDVRVPVQPSRDLTTGSRWFVLPAVMEGGGGLQVYGEL